MARRFKALHRLSPNQSLAADPRVHATLSASAGTGKTQVLTARVLRMLLGGVRPETILCLTFTKAGAAEMANRIGERLAHWVRLKDADLRKDLFALGEATDPATLQNARRLFARVLEAPGGLRIQTIHSFAQTLLAAFPAEAGIAPGFRPVEGREEQLLVRQTLAALIADAERNGDTGLIADVQALSSRVGETAAERYLVRCAHSAEALEALGPRDGITARIFGAMGLPEDASEEWLAGLCADEQFDCGLVREMIEANRAWGTSTGAGAADGAEAWLARSPEARAATLDELALLALTRDGSERKVAAGLAKICQHYPSLCSELGSAVGELLRAQRGLAFARDVAAGLRAGAAFAAAYEKAKRQAGVADFDDLIAWTRRLFATPGMGEWVRYKLDRQTDHILVDEAQDTNADQWAIVDALAEEYFAGAGAGAGVRTLFMVGDFKQAIFGFQGTDPREFSRMRETVRERSRLLEEAARGSDERAVEFRDLAITASFRSAPAVLELVDKVIEGMGPQPMGLERAPEPHVAFHDERPGVVELWRPFELAGGEEGDEAEEGWIDEPQRHFATALAQQIRAWLDEAPVLAATQRPLAAGDILVLVRSRGEFASLLVARLFAEGVPVAGIDRLHLSRPLAVQDLIAAIGFAVQPRDDLNLANLLVSPLLGMSQERLYEVAHGRSGTLWDSLREAANFAAEREVLTGLLNMADYTTPARFLETILSGPMQGRRKLLERLGPAARDPIDELVAATHDFERQELPSLDRFLAWFASGDVEVKRDPSAPVNAVRVMTVHGSKGLEAPLVILADATADPSELGDRTAPIAVPVDGRRVPVVRPRKPERISPFDEVMSDQEVRDLEEHFRLLYVGLTRAEERLVVAGVKRRRALTEDCWHPRVRIALEALGAEAVPDERWGERLVYRGQVPEQRVRPRPSRPELAAPELPAWLHAPAPPEARPPRPLAPSSLGVDQEAAPPPSPELRDAARRGTLLHALFERLPELAPDRRRAAALHWLERSAGVMDATVRSEMVEAACGVIEDGRFAELFAGEALAEAPIAATLPDGRVIAGTVDRLLVEEGRVRLIDYKTGRSVPRSAGDIPEAHRRQMSAYAEALAVIFPGRRIEPALLYTAGPALIPLAG
ncbi:double-strand break repair helicase AddA [Sphingomonas ginkgonis]|uniref:DNA 3'-5' helicase n=1 Tax=Sphingomonas ginkgonis TaxID=2315330 RepID=A0A429VA33_9SPHN|nr:double-strand break repair helicase AddA [Sphingomonas ginkgonis]RST30850.1 double-strand break repair helicase AddA [Sphingomonas ginkgonis]